MENRRILVGMSGGVDSTATCLMLQEQGYTVVGATLRTCDRAPAEEMPPAIAEAQALAARMGIEHHVVDVREAFHNTVIAYFVDEYLHGRTPNPCVQCNPAIKFAALCREADRLNCAQVATGHYSRFEDIDGKRYIVMGDDEKKDQSYFLWRLPQEVLHRCLFPLGALTKGEVRNYLATHGLKEKSQDSESMEVCFIKGDYRDFLKEQMPDLDTRIGGGMFVDSEGRQLGTHKGFPYYTVGQRKGLEIALGYPAYVLKLNAEKNTVMLGRPEQLETCDMLIENPLWVDEKEAMGDTELTVRIRYRSTPLPCTPPREVAPGIWLIHFKERASAVSPGQSAVFYHGRRLVGGAFIASQRGISQWVHE